MSESVCIPLSILSQRVMWLEREAIVRLDVSIGSRLCLLLISRIALEYPCKNLLRFFTSPRTSKLDIVG